MANSQSPILKHRSSGQRGFTLVECLIGLAISALLLAAVAVAFSASLKNYGENEQMFWAVNNARQALTRMTSQIRTGHSFDPLAADHQCNFWTAADEDTTYEFRSADRKLYLRRNATNAEFVLCDNVVDAKFTKILTDDGADCKSVQISLTVESGGTQRTLSTAAVVRRNLGS
jgi:prepilin-type N-terminal cleavage/methylation domain-containing protein